jgi:hypothetical protein
VSVARVAAYQPLHYHLQAPTRQALSLRPDRSCPSKGSEEPFLSCWFDPCTPYLPKAISHLADAASAAKQRRGSPSQIRKFRLRGAAGNLASGRPKYKTRLRICRIALVCYRDEKRSVWQSHDQMMVPEQGHVCERGEARNSRAVTEW